jgi:hypothetical protein
MGMSVHNHLYAVPSEKGPQLGPVGESFPPRDHSRHRRMVDEEDSEQTLSESEIEDVAESVHLYSPQASCGEKRSGLVCGGHSN